MSNNMAERNIQVEQTAIGTFGKNFGRLPDFKKSQDEAIVHRYAYSDPNSYPDEFKAKNQNWQGIYSASPADLANSVTLGRPVEQAPATPILAPTLEEIATGAQIALTQAEKDRTSTLGQVQNFNTETSSFFNTLQQAIRAKTGYESAGTAESELFKKAGLTGFDSLNQSLAMRKSELESNSNYLTDTLTKMGGIFQTQGANIKLGYDDAVSRYDKASAEVMSAAKDIADNKAAIDRLKLQHDLEMETEKWKLEHKTTGGNKVTLAEQKYDMESQMIKAFSGVIGADGYVSPQDWQSLRREWVTAGGNPTTFDESFAGFKNPENENYDKAGVVEEKKFWGSKPGFDLGDLPFIK